MTIMAILELIMMLEPQISSFDKPLTMDERKALVPIEFEQFDYVLAVHVTIIGKKGIFQSFPPEVGSIKAEIDGPNHTNLNLVPCD